MKKFYAFLVGLFALASVFSQCDVNNKYDKIISGYHSSIALKDNGVYSVWGSFMSEMGADVLSPQDINATNYADLNGRTIYKAALGGNKSGAAVDQAIILTDNGLWAWGANGTVLKNTYTGSQNALWGIVTPTGSNAYGLPQGVVPTSVKSMVAAYQTLLITTDSGFVYMLTQTSLAVEGNGGTATTAGTSTWQKVKINASTYLTNVSVVRGQVSSGSYNAFMALTTTGAVYTWGNTTYLGNSSASAARNYATQMTLPAEFASSVPAMIGVTGGIGQISTTKNTYYILSNAGNLYALGDNGLRQCGDFTTTERTSWVRVQKSATAGDYLNNVNSISPQEGNSSYPAVAAITSTGILYTWGVNSSGMIGRTDNGTLSGTMTTVSFNPGIPVGFSVANDQAVLVEVGGHTMVYTKVGSNQFCYVGHQISGSMGDGTTTGAGTTSTNTMIYNCNSTPAIAICGYVPVAASTTNCSIVASPTSIVANGISTSTITVKLYDASNNALTTSGGIVVISTTLGTLGTVTDNGNGTYTAVLTSGITSGTATLSYTINGAAASCTATVSFTGSSAINTTGTLSAFSTCAGTASAPQSFTVSGTGLSANITVTAPTGYEVCLTSGGTYTSSVTLTQTAGTVTSTTVYIRLKSNATNGASGNVTLTSGSTSVNLSVPAATVNALPTITLGYIYPIYVGDTSFPIPYTATTGTPSTYSIVTSAPVSMGGFTTVTNAALTGSPITVIIPSNVPGGSYNFELTVKNSTTGCVSTPYPVGIMVSNFDPGSIGSNQSICTGATPNPILSITEASGYSEGWDYTWEKSTTSATTGFSVIAGEIGIDYTPGSLTQTTYFRRTVTDMWGVKLYSNVVTITVNYPTSSSTSTTVCGASVPYTWNGQAYSTAGTYTYTTTNAGGCDSVATLVLSIGTTYTIIATSGPNGSISPADTTVVCSGSNQTYNFTPSSGYIVDSVIVDGEVQTPASTYNFTDVQADHTIYVSFKTLNSDSTNPAIAWDGAPAPDTVTICAGTVAHLCPLIWGWSNYQWYLDGVAIAAPTGTASCLDASEAGSYTLAAQDGAGVWSDPSPVVYVNVLMLPNAPTISAETDTVFCNGGNVILTSSSATNNQWFKDGSLLYGQTSQNDTVTVSGVYTAKTLSENGCLSVASNAITVTVNVAATPVITAGSATSFTQGDSVVLTSTPGETYQWYNNGVLIVGATSQTYTATQAGTYTVVITDANGCTSSPSSGIYVNLILPATPPEIAYNGAAAPDTVSFCSGKICPLNWGYSNYQWYLNGVALSAPYGTTSCLDSLVTGSYTLAAQNGSGVWSAQSSPVYVIVDTTCTVTSGTGGGVESKSLGDIIATRIYNNSLNSIPETNGVKQGIKYINSGVVINGINDLKLSNLAPARVKNTDAAYVSTPADLVNFTNAVEVLAIDYVKSNNTKAVLFGTKTLNNVYSHTKPICDRLRGAELLEIRNISVKGYSLVAYKIRKETGEVEYAINLSAGTTANRSTISLQSHWFTDNYQSDDVLYNFQLWAVNYDMVQKMAADIITNLQSNANVVLVGNVTVPKTYVTKGGRKSTDVVLSLNNSSNDTNGYFELREKANESSSSNQVVVKQIPFTAKANAVSNFTIPVSDKYEHNIYVYINNKLVDLVFFADGTWAIDYNKNNTTISNFSVINETSVTEKANEHNLFRNVNVSGTTKDYITIYKTMMGGGIAQNVSDYKSLLFNVNATGTGSMKVTLIKKSITNWNEQYTYTLNLNGNGDYGINLSDFKSSKYSTAINADDIVSVNFSFNNSRGTPVNMSINLSKVKFAKTVVSKVELNVLNIRPNPSTGTFYASFNSDVAQPLVLSVVEVSTGRVVKTNFVNAIKGKNEVRVDLESSKLSSGAFVVLLSGDDVKFNPARLLLIK